MVYFTLYITGGIKTGSYLFAESPLYPRNRNSKIPRTKRKRGEVWCQPKNLVFHIPVFKEDIRASMDENKVLWLICLNEVFIDLATATTNWPLTSKWKLSSVKQGFSWLLWALLSFQVFDPAQLLEHLLMGHWHGGFGVNYPLPRLLKCFCLIWSSQHVAAANGWATD